MKNKLRIGYIFLLSISVGFIPIGLPILIASKSITTYIVVGGMCTLFAFGIILCMGMCILVDENVTKREEKEFSRMIHQEVENCLHNYPQIQKLG